MKPRPHSLTQPRIGSMGEWRPRPLPSKAPPPELNCGFYLGEGKVGEGKGAGLSEEGRVQPLPHPRGVFGVLRLHRIWRGEGEESGKGHAHIKMATPRLKPLPPALSHPGGDFWGHFRGFWAIFWRRFLGVGLGGVLGPFWENLGHLGLFWDNLGQFWVISG